MEIYKIIKTTLVLWGGHNTWEFTDKDGKTYFDPPKSKYTRVDLITAWKTAKEIWA